MLPEKYGVCRGHAIDKFGNKAGHDIIIYDRLSYPTFLLRDEYDYSRKERIPIEGIYIYIECKHTLIVDGGDLPASCGTAVRQAESVKQLISQREKLTWNHIDSYIEKKGFVKESPEWLPDFRNPPFAMILSRRVAHKKPSNLMDDPEAIHQILLQASDIQKSEFLPDLIVLGKHNIMIPSYVRDGEQENNLSLFHLPRFKTWGYSCYKIPELAFGHAFAHLMAVLDWIRLGPLPWNELLNENL
ncbi:MAG: hypothetical protein L6290_12530 [Thermodesulfovibrionales bacterium]|nr:hypothetical protein [Thermodesulfovibrionales bacterium]